MRFSEAELIPTQAIREVVLRKLEIRSSYPVARHVIEDVRIRNNFLDSISDRIAFETYGYIWQSDIEQVQERVFVPKTWWDHAKQAFKKRFPKIGERLKIEEREIAVKISHHYAFPALNLEEVRNTIIVPVLPPLPSPWTTENDQLYPIEPPRKSMRATQRGMSPTQKVDW